MKILHFNVFKHLLPGIQHQLIDEKLVAEQLSEHVKWTIIAYSLDTPKHSFMRQASTPSNGLIPKRLSSYINLKKQAYHWLMENQRHYDVILLRYSPGDPFLLLNVKKIHNFISIHHTLEHYESLSGGGIINFLHSALERFSAPYILNKTTGIIGVTDEIRRYELSRITGTKPSHTYPNGISTSHQRKLLDLRTDEVKIAFIASTFVPWHGLDIVLENFKQSNHPVKLEIIGNVPNSLKVSDSRITYHGTLNKDKISEILNSVDIGLSCFALDRKGMKEACTLKVREYLESGIPVYAGHQDAALPEEFPYYTNKPFSLDNIVKIATKFKKTPRSSIRDASIQFIDKKTQLENTIDWITSIKNNNT